MDNGIILRLSGICKTFRSADGQEIKALSDINLNVKKNEFVCIIGPSGCGKTTLLRLVAGLEEPSAGEIYLNGTPSRTPSAKKGMIFQDYSLLPWRRILDNVAFGLELKGVAKRERYQIARYYLMLVGLDQYERCFPYELSGGMRQRVAIVRALANDPDLLLMDEPFGALDEQTRFLLQNELLNIWKADQKTVLFVTHSIDEGLVLGDKIIVMGAHPGTIFQIIDVKLPRPRDRVSDHFARYYLKIRNLLRRNIFVHDTSKNYYFQEDELVQR